MSEDKKKDIDQISGVETTGHSWDGLKELNNPLPRWWVWVFLVTIVWSVWYFVAYPAWPTLSGHTEGRKGYTQFKELQESQDEISERQQAYLERFNNATYEEILDDRELYAFAMAGGASAFKDNCATCHGTGAAGGKGYPNLIDDDWLWGGKLTDIHQTLQHGIRADNYDTRISQMPSFGKDKLLNRAEVEAVTDYVLSLSGTEPKDTFEQGQEIFRKNCATCHGEDGKGMHEFGAPNLTDAIWLYGGKRADVFESIYVARAGMMPAWGPRLDEPTIRQLTVYLHQLGGGESELDADLEEQEAPLPDEGQYKDAPLESPEYENPEEFETPIEEEDAASPE